MKKFKWRLYSLLMRAFSFFPLDSKKILFSCFQGTSYSDSPRYISEALHELDPTLKITWILPPQIEVPDYVKRINNNRLSTLFEYATAKVWVDNCRKPIWMVKREQQIYFQTWHGGLTLKKVEADVESELPIDYINSAKHDSELIDYFLSNSQNSTNLYKSSFWYDGEILEFGLPREDVLYGSHENAHKKVSDFYNNKNDIKYILYAPTFRKDGDLKCYSIDFPLLLKSVTELFGGEWQLLIRLHPKVKGDQSKIKYSSKIRNASKYEDINDLILASEIVISDYSSCLFDAMLAGDRVFIYASDIEDYSNDRGYYFKWDELPFTIATNTEQLIRNIKEYDLEEYTKKINNFKDSCGLYSGGEASKLVAKKICSLIEYHY